MRIEKFHQIAFSYKMLVLGVMLSLPTAIFGVLYYTQYQRDYTFTYKEIVGAQYLPQLYDAYFGALKGEAFKLAELPTTVRDTFNIASEHNTFATATPDKVIDIGLSTIQTAADRSNLTLDPDIDSYYSMDIAVFKISELLAATARLENTLQKLTKHFDSAQVAQAFVLKSRLEGMISDIDGDLLKIEQQNAAIATRNGLRSLYSNVKKQSDALTNNIYKVLLDLNQQQKLLSEAQYKLHTHQTTELYESVKQFYKEIHETLLSLLEKRLKEQFHIPFIQNMLLAFLCTIAAWGVCYAIVRRLQKDTHALAELLSALTEQRFHTHNPYVSWKNEIGLLGRAADTLRQKLLTMQQIEETAQRTAMAERSETQTALLQGAVAASSNTIQHDAPFSIQVTQQFNAVLHFVELFLQDFTASTERLMRGDFSQGMQGNYPQALQTVSQRFNKSIKELSQFFDELSTTADMLAAGNLNHSIKRAYDGTLQKVSLQLGQSIQSLNRLVTNVQQTETTITHVIGDLSQSVATLSHKTIAQAHSVETLSVNLRQLSDSLNMNNSKAKEAIRVGKEAYRGVDSAHDLSQQAANAIGVIAQQSSHILDIVATMNDIAAQTNLLALNASVEAARAGDAGKGFSVVAAEVRALAQRSAEAAQEISQIARNTVVEVEKGVAIVQKTETSLSTTANLVEQNYQTVDTLTTLFMGQTEALKNASDTINTIDATMQQNAALANAMAQSAHLITQQSNLLTSNVAHFNTSGDAKNNHLKLTG